MMLDNYEKMLPISYSIADWPQLLCITIDTVCCITSTPLARIECSTRLDSLMAGRLAERSVRTVGLILRTGRTLRLQSNPDLPHTAQLA